MTASPFPRAPTHLEQRPVEILLRGGQSLDGILHIPESMPLLNFLGIRRFFLNMTSVKPAGTSGDEAMVEHLSLRLSNVVWVIPREPSLHLSTASAPAGAGRAVVLQLVDGLTLTVDLNIAEEQRMSDYLDANSGFVPLFEARVESSARTIERLAVNHEAILAIREVSGSRP